MTARFILISTLTILPALSARADVFHLAGGGQIEGELLNPDQRPRTTYIVRTRMGGTVTLDDRQVKEVEATTEAQRKYRALLPKMPATVEGQWAMAEFCRENHLLASREFHLEEILKLDPEHEQARHGLGYSRVDGRWVKTDEYMRSRGYVLDRAAWRLPHELAIEERKRKFELAQKDWKRNLKRWRSWLGGKRGLEGQREIQNVDDWRAAAPMVEMLDRETTRDGKLLWIDVLGRLNTHDAWAALVRYSVEDDDPRVRERCLSLLQESGSHGAVRAYIQMLGSDDNVRVNRAAIGLGRMQDPSAVPALIDHLITQHKTVQQSAPAGGLGPIGASFSNNGGAGLNAGNSTKVVEADVYNQDVRSALVSITNQRFHDPDDWRAWYEETHTPKGVNLRRRED